MYGLAGAIESVQYFCDRIQVVELVSKRNAVDIHNVPDVDPGVHLHGEGLVLHRGHRSGNIAVSAVENSPVQMPLAIENRVRKCSLAFSPVLILHPGYPKNFVHRIDPDVSDTSINSGEHSDRVGVQGAQGIG